MLTARQQMKRLGVSGIGFLLCLALFIPLYFTGNAAPAFLVSLLLIPFALIVTIRILHWIQLHALWSVRNRLLFVYWLMGVLPLLLILILVSIGAWAFTTELAVYLATSALDRRLANIDGATHVLSGMTTEQRATGSANFQKAINNEFPGFRLYVTDESGHHKYPADLPDLTLPNGWKNASGLLVMDHRFFGWSHIVNSNSEITALAPLSKGMVSELVPNLGKIGLYEGLHGGRQAAKQVESLSSEAEQQTVAAYRWDVPLVWVALVKHSHLDQPNQTFDAQMGISSRPSAVFSELFGKAEDFSGTLFQIFVGITILFCLVEAVAIWIGIRLSGRITGAVNQLSEGTWRVIRGDFGHRIPGIHEDQLGELSNSFNKMTENLQRLFQVEKEKERLQTELEIAREVQNQLYPKGDPPLRGLRLIAVCDPARMVSGDFYDYTAVGAHQLAFAIGDVAGKGISAALLMATMQAALRSQVAHAESTHADLNSAQVTDQLNRQIYAHTAPEKYATFFIAVYDAPTQTLTYTNAGHLSPLLLRKGEFTPLDSNGTVVGAFPAAVYEASSLIMQHDDLLVCYTDGITEPENAYGEAFGEDRLMELVKKHAHQPDNEILRIILDAVRSWTGTGELFDDMTLLLARGVQLT